MEAKSEDAMAGLEVEQFDHIYGVSLRSLFVPALFVILLNIYRFTAVSGGPR